MLRHPGEAPPEGAENPIPKDHKVLLENERVRVLEIRIPPKEKTDMHWHPPCVVYQISEAKVRMSFKDGTSREAEAKPNTVNWSNGGWHQVENLGSTDDSGLIVELKK
jgi:mannose-6-phosphate isomerase-like protein (cupin superfamily)